MSSVLKLNRYPPGGKLADNDTIVNVALELNDACWNTYAGDA